MKKYKPLLVLQLIGIGIPAVLCFLRSRGPKPTGFFETYGANYGLYFGESSFKLLLAGLHLFIFLYFVRLIYELKNDDSAFRGILASSLILLRSGAAPLKNDDDL